MPIHFNETLALLRFRLYGYRRTLLRWATMLRWRAGYRAADLHAIQHRQPAAVADAAISDGPALRSQTSQAPSARARTPAEWRRLELVVDNQKSAPPRRPIIVRPALILATLFIGVAAVPSAFAINTALVEVHNTAEFWRRRLQAAYWPVVRDSQGAFVGMLPAAGRDLLAGVPAVTRADIAPACIDLLIAREDRHAGTWRQLFGIDMLALPRVLTLQRGGSTLPMQVARLLAPEWRSLSTLDRKRLEWGAAATLQDLFGSPQETAVAYLNLAPFAIHRGDIRGIAAFADVAFGKTPSALSRAECAIAAVAVNKPILMSDTAEARTRWTGRKQQAIVVLQATYGADAAAAVAEIKALGGTPPMRALMPGISTTATRNITARTRALVLPYRPLIEADRRAHAEI